MQSYLKTKKLWNKIIHRHLREVLATHIPTQSSCHFLVQSNGEVDLCPCTTMALNKLCMYLRTDVHQDLKYGTLTEVNSPEEAISSLLTQAQTLAQGAGLVQGAGLAATQVLAKEVVLGLTLD